MLSFNVDAGEIARALGRLASDIEPAVEAGLDAVATRAKQAKDRQVGRTYARPVRRLKSGNPAWRRSGDLRENQTVEKSRGSRSIITKGNAEKYEGRLSNLPTGVDGINRTNAAAADAATLIEPQVGLIFENEVRNHLRLNR